MATENGTIDFTVEAGADLSAYQYRIIDLAGTLAESSDVAIGSLRNKPSASGVGAQVDVFGKMKGIAGAAVAAQAGLKVASGGFLIAVASGDNAVPVGKNLNAAVASGDIFSFFGNFINGAAVKTSSQ